MITRRDLVKWGVVAPALAGLPLAARGQEFEGMDALVLDTRLNGRAGSIEASKIYSVSGDVTALWYDVLDARWRRPGFVLGGVTGADVLFVLEVLAAQHGRRVVSRRPLPAIDTGPKSETGAIAWLIAPVHPSVRA